MSVSSVVRFSCYPLLHLALYIEEEEIPRLAALSYSKLFS
jgi:hypothetical protein